MRRALVIAGLAGLALALATRYAYQLPREWWWIAKIGGPWLAVAFLVGRAARRPSDGALAGAFALVVATLAYYAVMGLVQHAYDRSPLGLWWLLVALPSGAGFGWLAAWTRDSDNGLLGTVALAAAFAGEALISPLRATPGPAVLMIAALLLPLLTVRDAHRQTAALAGVAVLSVVAAAAAQAVLVATGYA